MFSPMKKKLFGDFLKNYLCFIPSCTLSSILGGRRFICLYPVNNSTKNVVFQDKHKIKNTRTS